MDLSKAFDCIPHDLLISKLHAYGFDEIAPVLIYSYLRRRKKSVRINNTYSSFQTISSGVPPRLCFGPILLSIYMNDLFLVHQPSDIRGSQWVMRTGLNEGHFTYLKM